MGLISREINRQVGVLVNRKGNIEFVMVGDAHKVVLPEFGRLRGGEGRFRGIRLVHTHLRGEPLTRDDLVDLTRLKLDLVAAIDIDPKGNPRTIQYATIIPSNMTNKMWETYGPFPFHSFDIDFLSTIEELEKEFSKKSHTGKEITHPEGKAILIHVALKHKREEAESSINELEALCHTAGVEVVDKVIQFREKIDPKYVVGKGKLEEVVLLGLQHGAELLIFDREITPTQAKTISLFTDLKVIDRTQLILDIFAKRAKSRDGKIQVELAQLRYRLPRLSAKDDSLSRLTGGIGGRGPGETVLAVEKNRVKQRIAFLEKELKLITKQRETRRKLRNRSNIPVISIIGYTNAGKSTLLNTLTKSNVLVEDKLFATLDPTSRSFLLPDGKKIILSDTVGFIRNLPPSLFNAFKATLEELQHSSLLLHIVDISNRDFEMHIEEVEKILVSLNVINIPRILILNKIDLIEQESLQKITNKWDGIPISAKDPSTLPILLEKISKLLNKIEVEAHETILN